MHFRGAVDNRPAYEAARFGDIIVKISCNGIEWSVFVEGNGKPLVFLHGFPFDQELYHNACQPLTDRYRVVIPDLPGFGESRFRTGEEPTCLAMSDFADGLLSLLDALDEPNALICGLSMGGYIAMQFFRRYPKRLAGLIFCDTRSTPDLPTTAEKRRLLADSVHQTGVAFLADQMVSSLLSPRTLAENQKVVAFLTKMISRQDASAVAAAARGMADRDDSTLFLKEIAVPTLFLVGEDDRISPPEVMRQMADSVPGSEFQTIPGAGHLPPLENPELFTLTIRRFADCVYDGA